MPFSYRGKRSERSRSRNRANFRPSILLLDERILLSVTIQVNAAAGQHAISPLIYGLNNADSATLTYLNVPLNRSGGNLSSTYNWQQDAANHDSDYFYESIADGNGTPEQSSDQFISSTQGSGAQPIVTIPTMPYVAKLGPNRSILASYSVAKYGPQQQTDPFDHDAGNGILANGTPITGNDPNDAYVPNSVAFEQTWVQNMVAKFGTASDGGVQHFALDNEPSIWFGTHGDIAPTGLTMDQVLNYMIAYGSMIKSVDPTAQVQGPEEWGYLGTIFSGFDQQYGNAHGYSNLPDQAAHGGMDYFPYLLQQLSAYQQQTGVRILDTLTVHDYPQGGEFSENDSTTMDQLRNVSTRSLWDPNYVDQSWIDTQVEMIPRLQNWVNTYYPRTNIGITEYNWGDTQFMNGATSEADVLGIFGQQGLYMANLWPLENYPSTASEYPAYNAIKLYRNYDGHDSTFGDTSVSTAVPNPDQVSAFSAVRSSDGALTVMVDNKNLYDPSNPNATITVQINIANFASNGKAQEWQLAAVNPNNMSVSAITHLSDVTLNGNILTVTLPQESVTLFVIEPAAQKALPTILMVAPSTATSGSSIVLSGTNFTGATNVTFSAAGTTVPAASFIVNSSTQITVTVPAQAALPNTVDLFVTTSQGTSAQTAGDKFTFAQSQNNPGQLEFLSSTQLAQETDTIANIQISRSGGSDGTVSVSYATSDGTGQAAMDYVAASGTITFNPGQVSQTISVTILEPGKSSGTSTFAVTLSNPTGGATLGETNVLTMTIDDSLPGQPIPQNLGSVAFFLTHSQEAYQYFVRQAYQQFLNRQPDATGIAYWVLQMQQGLTDEHLEADFAASPEFFAVNGGTDVGLVTGMYKDLLLRNPDPAGINYWVAQLQAGASVSSVAFGFTASAERESIRITDDYMTYLGRQPDQAGLTFWLNDFLNGGTNEDLVAGFVGSTEYYSAPDKGDGNRAAWIATAYLDILHRVAKPGDIVYWESVLE
jgi:Glycoside hydrolase family 44/Calx-beta domain/Domain of unknown function (DUF4214)